MKRIILFLGLSLFGLSLTANSQRCCKSKSKEKSCHSSKSATAENSISTNELVTVSFVVTDTIVTDTFTVYGNCGMCEKTIEGSLKYITGAQVADWNKETDQMVITYIPAIISLDHIKQRIADVGYDSDTHRVKVEVYDALPGCCQYDRPVN